MTLPEWLFSSESSSREDVDIEAISLLRDDPKIDAALPDNDLLRALHVYISEFYSRLPDGEKSMGSMTPSALIALGALLEETMAGKMKGNAWKAFMHQEKDFDEYGRPAKKFFDPETKQW